MLLEVVEATVEETNQQRDHSPEDECGYDPDDK